MFLIDFSPLQQGKLCDIHNDMRSYKKTHQWITFNVDLSRAPAPLWLLLGEAASKCEHIAGVPLEPKIADDLHRLYFARGAAANTAIEGNTLTEDQVRQQIQGTLQVPPSKEYLRQEVQNVVDACNHIEVYARTDGGGLTLERIEEFNRLVLRDLQLEEGVVPGAMRTHSVVVGNGVYRGAPAEDCEFLTGELCTWLDGLQGSPGQEIPIGIVKAVLAHLYLAWIHPFGDGNGRTARLVEFLILLAAGVPTPAAHLLSNHYNQTRSEYYRQLDRASKSGGDVLPFIQYAVQGFVDGLREQLGVIRKQQWNVAWQNYVHEQFRDKKDGEVTSRQKHLVLDLSDEPEGEAVHISMVALLTPRLAQSYASKTLRTVERDIKALQEMDLVKRTGLGVVANREKILAFLPWRKECAQPK